MRNLEDIEQDLAAAREALSHVEGTPAEVYSRIVGYYRSVRNWNRGKREEYGERKLYRVVPEKFPAGSGDGEFPEPEAVRRVLFFTRPACPACPPARDAAGRLGVPVDLVNADTAEGLAEAVKWNVLSTPTAILLTGDGRELGRARDSRAIAAFGALVTEELVPETVSL
ncbi:MAG: hypothetical protein LBP32_07925 [Spirochaetaceae bacterium]|jgi:ribonucleoside-triphosphate reductase|nr:hypothetical protein [Spirochaetaceae bacterium]